MRKISIASVLIFATASSIFAQYSGLKVETASYQPQATYPTIQQGNSLSILNLSTSDTLRYFLNKHYYRNSNAGSPSPNTQYFTLLNPYPNNALVISHCGAVFLNSSTITVTGLEGIVTRRSNAVSQNIPLKLYLCNVNGSNLPILPPLDSVTAIASATTNGAWLGANFNTPVVVNGNFAVLFRNATTTAGDTLGLFINNACTPTSTCPASRKFGEGLGVLRVNGNFQTNTNTFGAGTDYEFIVAPRVQFNYSSGISVVTPTVCLNGFGQFMNATSPMSLVENRMFNFNKFAAVWGALSNTLLPVTDSIYNWNFSGSSTGPLTTKDAIALFNANGVQTASLLVKYNKSRAGGLLPSVQDVSTATLNVSSANTPTVSITGNTLICSGSSTTLTASGTATYNWGGPQFNNPVVIVSPTTTTVYTVIANNAICLGYYNYTVNVASNPSLVVTGPGSACLGGTVFLNVLGANSFTWSNGSTSYSTIVSASVLGVQIITVTGFSAPCPPASAIKSITVNALPSVSLSVPSNTLCTLATGGHTIQLVGAPMGGLFGGPFVVNGIFSPNSAGTATLSYTFTDPSTQCSNSAVKTVTVLTCQSTGLTENSKSGAFSIYPNPSTDGRIELSGLDAVNRVKIYNTLGKLVFDETVNGQDLSIDLSGYGNGVYFVKLITPDNSAKTYRIVIQKP